MENLSLIPQCTLTALLCVQNIKQEEAHKTHVVRNVRITSRNIKELTMFVLMFINRNLPRPFPKSQVLSRELKT